MYLHDLQALDPESWNNIALPIVRAVTDITHVLTQMYQDNTHNIIHLTDIAFVLETVFASVE